MERITSHQVLGLMEAYNAVHAPQINEEQVWEEVETWVNSLLEEGYDLSEYTWEEMYESYLEEQGGGRSTAPRNQNVFKFPTSSAGTRRGAAAGSRTPTPTFQNTGGFGRYAPPSAQVKTPAPSPAPARPATPAPAGTRPATPAPASASAKPTPAPAPKSSGSSVSDMIAASKARQASTPSASPKPATPAPSAAKPATAPAAKPTTPAATTGNPPLNPPPLPPITGKPSLRSDIDDLKKMGDASRQRQASMLNQSFDIFDTIKGHLIDEGYADTEEAALQIMANMSEEWKNSIIG